MQRLEEEEGEPRALRDDKPRADGTSANQRTQRKVCPFPAPPNRYNIKPGYRWDGRVRGNGFEEKFLSALRDR